MPEIPYFAYGANMNLNHIARMCPKACLFSRATLPFHRFRINALGFATIIPDKAASVPGVLWRLDETALRGLDEYEGVDEGEYFRQWQRVWLPDGTVAVALLYRATDPTEGIPEHAYMADIAHWAEHHNLPGAYVTELKKWQP